jgi:glycosyltransferase involved in cell wall biosynthesis
VEAQPFTLLEAMRAQCAIIASDVPGNRELLDTQRGMLVEPQPAKFAAAIDYLLGDNQKKTELAQNAYNYFRSKHKLEDQVRRLIYVYRGSLDTKERNLNIADSSRTKNYSPKY